MTYKIAFLLGAGASKPLGIPTTADMADEFLNMSQNEEIKNLFKDIDQKDIEMIIKSIHQIVELPNYHGVRLLERNGVNTSDLNKMSEKFAETEIMISKFIREKCLNFNKQIAVQIYKKLLNLQIDPYLQIFTTNYDVSLEETCRELKMIYSDGFVSTPHDYHKNFQTNSFTNSNIQIFKLHGSVNWWYDDSFNKVFNLDPRVNGFEHFTNMMIYPAQKENIYNFPFNILQSLFIRTLDQIDELIVIGHKFADTNILSPIKAALENEKFRLTIVNISANQIKRDIFNNHDQVQSVEKSIENWILEDLGELQQKINTAKPLPKAKFYESKPAVSINNKSSIDFLKKRNIFDIDAQNFGITPNSVDLINSVEGYTTNKPFVLFSSCPKILLDSADIKSSEFKNWISKYNLIKIKNQQTTFLQSYEPNYSLGAVTYRYEGNTGLKRYLEFQKNGFLEQGFTYPLIYGINERNFNHPILHLCWSTGAFWAFVKFCRDYYDFIKFRGEFEIRLAVKNSGQLTIMGFGGKTENGKWAEPYSIWWDMPPPKNPSPNLLLTREISSVDLLEEQYIENFVHDISNDIANSYGLEFSMCYDKDGSFNFDLFSYYR